MTRYAVLLRGVNVGGRNKVPMATLRDLLEKAGCLDVTTYLQSGNAVVTSRRAEARVASDVAAAVDRALGLVIDVVVRSGAELADVEASNPFARGDADPGRQLLVAFCRDLPSPDGLVGIDPKRAAPDELFVRGREIYLLCPDGFGNSKVLSGVERRLGTPITVRNWRTVTELAARCSSTGG